ncbi:MAG: hypothetical protein AB1758_26155, partial [Candidatus Eremiobacterota bacterium]
GALGAGSAGQQQADAQRAAESGVQYALSQIKQTPTWRGDKDMVTVNRPDLFVQEDRGNVVGLVRTPAGQWSQFRIRFNFNDGAAGADNLDDSALPVANEFVSFNNLLGGAAAPAYRADQAGWQVDPAVSTVHHQVPLWSVNLAVEGRSGPNLSRLVSPGTPNPNVTGAVSTKVVEAIYQVPNMGPLVEESASMAGGDMTVELNPSNAKAKVDVKSKDKNKTPRVRSKGSIAVSGAASPNYVSKDGEVKVSDTGGTFTASYNASEVSVNSPQGEAAADPFYTLAWTEVKRADASDSTLAGGTYVWSDDGSLLYFDMTYEEYKTQKPPTTAGTAVTLPAGVTSKFDKGKAKLTLSQDLYISKSAKGVVDFSLITREGAPELPPDDPDAASGDVVTVAASTLADPANAALLYQFLQTAQAGQGGDIDIEKPGSDGMELKWNGSGPGSITYEPNDTGLSLEDCLRFIWGDTASYPEYSYDPTEPALPFDPGATAIALGLPAGGDNGEIDIPAEDDTLTASDLEVEFKPATTGGSVVLTSEGDVRLVGAVKGKGGSITANGEIHITGLGADFSSGTGDDAVNMYAVKDIVFSSLDETTPGAYEFRDVKLKGVVYTQGDFIARLGSSGTVSKWGKLDLEGVLIAYGGDPSGDPGQGGKGKVDIKAEEVKMEFDPIYIGALANKLPASFQLRSISWTNNP